MTESLALPRAPWQPCSACGWQQQQVKRSFAITLGKMLQNAPASGTDEEVPYLKAQHVQWDEVRLDDLPSMWASPTEVANLQVRSGDLLVCEGGEVGRARVLTEVPPETTIIQNALHLVRGKAGQDTRYLAYVLRHAATNDWFDVLCNRSTIAHFTVDKFGDMWVWVPLANLEQKVIADYLDRETGQIDALIGAKERALGLLSEKRKALISRAVTRGLDHSAPLRDSGIPWLGQIPAHWRTRKIAWLYRERDDRGEAELPLLVVSINYGVVLREFSEDRIEDTAADFNSYKIARQGDVAFNKMRMWQGAVGVAPVDGLVSPDYVVATPSGPLASDYAQLLFRTPAFSAECARHSHGIVWDRLRLYWDGFREIEVPIPPPEEQTQIVSHVAREGGKLDALRAATERSIAC